jgi:glycogen synthase
LNINFKELFVQNKKLSTSVEYSSRLIAMTSYLIK